MKAEDDDLFEVANPEPFFAFLAGGVSGYLTALVVVLVAFPLAGFTAWQGHLYFLGSVLVLSLAILCAELAIGWWKGDR